MSIDIKKLMKDLDIDLYAAAKIYLENVEDQSLLGFYAFQLTGGDKILSEGDADQFLNSHYGSIGVDYENDKELDALLSKCHGILRAIRKGRITVNYEY